MGPFTQRPSERNSQDAWEQRSDRDFHLRAMRDDHVSEASQSEMNLSNFGERENTETPYHHSNDIRNLGFFKEQERHFTQSEDEEEWQERQSPINFILASCIVVILCVVGWFGYHWASKPLSGEPPLITAEQTPLKVRPENPGGIVIPHQDKLIYGRIAPSSPQQQPVEHLLPAPEQPIAPPPQQQGQPQTFVDANGQVYYAYPAPQQLTPPQQPYQGQPTHPSQGGYDQNGYSQNGYAGTPQNGYAEYYAPIQENTAPQPSAYQPLPQQPGMTMQPGAQGSYNQVQQSMPVAPPQQQEYTSQPGYTPQQGYAPTPTQQLPMMAQQNPPAPLPTAPSQQYSASTTPLTGGQTNNQVQSNPHPQQAAVPAAQNTLDQLIEQELGTPDTKTLSQKSEEATNKAKGQKAKITSSPYRLQVATLDSKADAEKEVKRIRAIDKNLFKDKIISIEAMTLSGTKKPSYRVIINGFDTPNSATQFSNKLKIHKVKGIVLRQPT